MLIPLNWVAEFTPIGSPPDELAERLTLTGNEIEEIEASPVGPVLKLKLTPNRADMLSMLGAAREISALQGRRLPEPSFDCPADPDSELPPEEPQLKVSLEDLERCPRYRAAVIRGVQVGPSPDWLRLKLEAAGQASINNVVDVTNYVMLELGQPLHAFDYDTLHEGRIRVRRAGDGEQFVAIGGQEYALDPDMLVIADADRAIALAGVKGGQETEVHGGTTNILLEAAYFEPSGVRRTARRSGISSTASYRFERGTDPNGVDRAARRAAGLILELAGGKLTATVDAYPTSLDGVQIPYRPDRCRDLLGVAVGDGEQEELLGRLGVQVEAGTEIWRCVAPTWRPDLAIEEDLIEEVGRLWGYDRLPETLPQGAGSGARSVQDQRLESARSVLLAHGLYEAVTSTLVAGADLDRLACRVSPSDFRQLTAVPLRNSLSEEFDTLRPSLLPGLVAAAQHNWRRGLKDLFLFEIGAVHGRDGAGDHVERVVVAGLLLGSRLSKAWNADRTVVDFYTVSGLVENLLRNLGQSLGEVVKSDHPMLHPGRAAVFGIGADGAGGAMVPVGQGGELHPDLAGRFDLPRGVYLFEFDLETVLAATPRERRYQPPSRFPAALRDLAFVVEKTVPAQRIADLLREAGGDLVRSVRLFDVYEGKGVPEGRVSLAFALELGAADRTLTEEEVDARLAAGVQRVEAELGGELRR